MENDPDKITIGKVVAGDSEAFREIIKRHGGHVFSLVSGIVRNAQDAEEITSDIFMKAFEQITRFRGESKFSTWLYRIAYNTAISHTRLRRKPTEEIDERRMEALTDDDVDAISKEARLEELEAALKKLLPEDNSLIELFYIQNLPICEISAITGDSPGNIKVKLHRTRKRLAAMLINN